MNNSQHHPRPRIDPLVRLEYENAALLAKIVVLQEENTALRGENAAHVAQDLISQQTIQLAAERVLTLTCCLQVQLQPCVWDEV